MMEDWISGSGRWSIVCAIVAIGAVVLIDSSLFARDDRRAISSDGRSICKQAAMQEARENSGIVVPGEIDAAEADIVLQYCTAYNADPPD